MTIVSTKSKKKKNYLREVQQELKKVTWTSKDELVLCTKIVLVATFLFAMGIYVVDLGIRGGFSFLSFFSRLIGG